MSQQCCLNLDTFSVRLTVQEAHRVLEKHTVLPTTNPIPVHPSSLGLEDNIDTLKYYNIMFRDVVSILKNTIVFLVFLFVQYFFDFQCNLHVQNNVV